MSLFEPMLRSAYNSGTEVILELKGHHCDSFTGRIQELESTHCKLFHSGTGGGVLWMFKLEDIAHCGLIIEPPDFSFNTDEETTKSTQSEATKASD